MISLNLGLAIPVLATELEKAAAACEVFTGAESLDGWETLKNIRVSAAGSPSEPKNISLLVFRKS